jgi:GntR family transcriptional regulator, vanillate catabolism transcriptional regulator
MTVVVDSAVEELRKLIISGEIGGGERLTESKAASLLGLSRTPLRIALTILEREGVLEKLDGRGYRVRSINLQTVEHATELRAMLEGLAAGRIAANGPSQAVIRAVESSIAMSEAVVDRPTITKREISTFQESNRLFHDTIIDECGNDYVRDAYEQVRRIPILRPGAFTKRPGQKNILRQRMTVAHSHHAVVWEAIQLGDAIRAENMMREHANVGLRYARLFLEGKMHEALPFQFQDAI